MKLKLDDNGNAVIRNNMPVYVHDDGKEIEFDAPAAMKKIAALNSESAGHRHALNEVKEKLTPFEGIDPEKAKEALKTVENLSTKKLLDAGEVDKVKAQLQQAFESEKGSLNAAISEKDETIKKLVLSNMFSGSAFLRDKTFLTPDIAQAAFGSNFDITLEGTDVKVVPMLNGSQIFSRSKPGEVAEFEEAISLIIEARPDSKALLKSSSHAGSGGTGGAGGVGNGENPFKSGNRTQQAALVRENRQRARMLANEAGVSIPGLTD